MLIRFIPVVCSNISLFFIVLWYFSEWSYTIYWSPTVAGHFKLSKVMAVTHNAIWICLFSHLLCILASSWHFSFSLRFSHYSGWRYLTVFLTCISQWLMMLNNFSYINLVNIFFKISCLNLFFNGNFLFLIIYRNIFLCPKFFFFLPRYFLPF